VRAAAFFYQFLNICASRIRKEGMERSIHELNLIAGFSVISNVWFGVGLELKSGLLRLPGNTGSCSILLKRY